MTDPSAPVTSPWLDREQAAVYAKSSLDALGDALRSGELRGHQIKRGGKWRIHINDLDAWIRGEEPNTQPARVTRRAS